MTRLMLDAVILMALACFSFALCRVLRREVEPLRRRDLTLAGADSLVALEKRIGRSLRWEFDLAAGIFCLDFVLFMVIFVVVSNGAEPSPWLYVPFYIFTIFLMFMLTCHGVVTAMATRACRKNRPLPGETMLIAIFVPEAVLWQIPAVGSFAWEFSNDGQTATLLLIPASLLFAVFMVFIFPVMAHNRLLKAYPYTE